MLSEKGSRSPMTRRGDVPVSVDFMAWFDTLPLAVRRQEYMEVCRRYNALRSLPIQSETYFSQVALKILARNHTEFSLY